MPGIRTAKRSGYMTGSTTGLPSMIYLQNSLSAMGGVYENTYQ
ncbi:hypothetical protein GCWU000342_02121 [Shuttleworthella satelles DSM 14600]|uniref:Uncharacterized protein n=1 Tax=Shuttleworthella satelles DSM 14600 TaxID=626523 RepID=C4GDE8_9FIRM|nr:hypothetical protein GCWU000342_02121 [Shuttleworthia satelles DSM 14600]